MFKIVPVVVDFLPGKAREACRSASIQTPRIFSVYADAHRRPLFSGRPGADACGSCPVSGTLPSAVSRKHSPPFVPPD